MFGQNMNGMNVDAIRSRVSEELRRYVHSEYGERDADWLLVKGNSQH